jgi:flagellar motor switch protein FliN/FliY
MSAQNQAIDQFLDAWTQEFGRAVEMFSGEQPSITCGRTKEIAPSETADLLWWKQTFAGVGEFTTWIGAKEATWSALGGAAGGVALEEAQSTYLEIIGQAQHGAATIVSAGLPKPVRCQEGQIRPSPKLDGFFYAMVGLTLASGEVPAITIAIEPAITAVIGSSTKELTRPKPLGSEVPHATPMLNRLMDLELPLSVALGRAQMPIRDVLKVTSGSLIELDHGVGDYVELIVHGTVVARGEVVSIKGNYGVRIKEIISQQDRISLYSKG